MSAGGRRIALLGVVSPKFQTRETHIDDPKEAILTTLPLLKDCDVTVALAYLPEDELRQLAAALPEVDAIIGGPTGQSLPLERVGASLVGSATNKGKFLIELSLGAESGRPRLSGRTVEMTPQFANDADQERNLKSFYAELGKRDFRRGPDKFCSASNQPTFERLHGGKKLLLRGVPSGRVCGLAQKWACPRLGYARKTGRARGR